VISPTIIREIRKREHRREEAMNDVTKKTLQEHLALSAPLSDDEFDALTNSLGSLVYEDGWTLASALDSLKEWWESQVWDCALASSLLRTVMMFRQPRLLVIFARRSYEERQRVPQETTRG